MYLLFSVFCEEDQNTGTIHSIASFGRIRGSELAPLREKIGRTVAPLRGSFQSMVLSGRVFRTRSTTPFRTSRNYEKLLNLTPG
jgi:hypothetical protein